MGAVRLCFLLLCLFLVSISSVRKFDRIDDLKNIGYGRSYPRHGLQLLFWFAQNVNVDQNNNIHMHWSFVPSRGDFGFHWFGNRERILPSLRSGESYYSVGNLNDPSAYALPEYVRMNRYNNQPERNMDRLIISVDENRPNRISRVFITAHNRNRNDFNPDETYEISPALISQISQIARQSYQCDNNSHIIFQSYVDEYERSLLFLRQARYHINNCRKKRSTNSQCNEYEGMKLEIKTNAEGYVKLKWKNIPADIMQKHKYVYIDICQNTHSSDPNVEPTQVRKEQININTLSGNLDTSVKVNAGLQPRLRMYTSYFSNEEIWNGPEIDGANGVIPIRIKGFDASLQLYARDGKACARLYIKKTFSNWKDVFYYSWVGFYKRSQDKNDAYYTHQYAVKFAMVEKTTSKNYDVYQYDSDLAISPGVQIRFLLDKGYTNVLAQTTPWESDKKVTSLCDKGNLWPESSAPWSDPEFFYEPQFYDANNILPIKIQKYDAGLQLFTKDGKACARLYIKKTFTNWKDTFYYSWVGFYTDSQEANNGYYTHQYVVNFEKMEESNKNFDVYQYKSEMSIAPGVQLRFIMDKGYDKKLVETEPWKSG